MEHPNKSRGLLISTVASVMLGTFGLVNAAAAFGGEDSSHSAPLTVTIETPTGGTSQLTYRTGAGWTLDRANQATLGFTRVASRDQQPEEVGQAMTVFIDGPTGYAYVWTVEKGWSFVGRVAKRKP